MEPFRSSLSGAAILLGRGFFGFGAPAAGGAFFVFLELELSLTLWSFRTFWAASPETIPAPEKTVRSNVKHSQVSPDVAEVRTCDDGDGFKR